MNLWKDSFSRTEPLIFFKWPVVEDLPRNMRRLFCRRHWTDYSFQDPLLTISHPQTEMKPKGRTCESHQQLNTCTCWLQMKRMRTLPLLRQKSHLAGRRGRLPSGEKPKKSLKLLFWPVHTLRSYHFIHLCRESKWKWEGYRRCL